MKICHVIVYLDGSKLVFKGYVLPGGKIGDSLHLGHTLVTNGEFAALGDIEYKDSGPHLSKSIEAKYRIGFYGIKPR